MSCSIKELSILTPEPCICIVDKGAFVVAEYEVSSRDFFLFFMKHNNLENIAQKNLQILKFMKIVLILIVGEPKQMKKSIVNQIKIRSTYFED